MFEYKFAKASIAFSRGIIQLTACERVVAEHAAQGWRLVQILVAVPASMPTEYDLIFERPKSAAGQSEASN